MDMDSEARARVRLTVLGARNLQSQQAVDAYCVVRYGRQLRRRVRSATIAATCDPTWQLDVDLSGDAVRVEVFNEKSFFFDMFAHGDALPQRARRVVREARASAEIQEDSDTGSCEGSSGEEERLCDARKQQDASRKSLGDSDELLGSIELSVSSLLKRAASGEVATDGWYCLQGTSAGEIRIGTVVWRDDDPADGEEKEQGSTRPGSASNDSTLTDSFGFRIPSAASDDWRHLRSYQECRESRRSVQWQEMMDASVLDVPRSQWTQEQATNVRRLVHGGIARSWRQRVYMAVSGAQAKKEAEADDYYQSLLERIDTTASPAFQQIELDIDRTFHHSGTKISTEQGRLILRRVLKAYSMRNAVVGYCQGLNFVVAFLTLQLDEESTFWVLAALCEDLFPGYYTPAMTETQIDMQVLKQLITEDLPRLHAFASDVGLPLELLASQWLLCLFTTTFPAETVFRILDCLMLEGPRFAFAVIMAHLRRMESHLIHLDDFQAALSYIKETENTLLDADAFLRLAVEEARHMPLRRILAAREEQSLCVQEEATRAQRARLFHQQLATVYQIPALSMPAASLLRFFHTQAQHASSVEVACLLTLLCHGLVWLAEQSRRWNK